MKLVLLHRAIGKKRGYKCEEAQWTAATHSRSGVRVCACVHVCACGGAEEGVEEPA